MTIKDFKKFNESNLTPFTKQTMKMDIDWVTTKDFDVHYCYEHVRYPISNDKNGYNYLCGAYGSKLANTNKFMFLTKKEIAKIYEYATKYGGSPNPLAFDVKKRTKLEVKVNDGEYYNLTVKIMEGTHSGKEFETSLIVFRTYLAGTPKDENLVVSKYRIFLNGLLFKPKYYTNLGRIKLALLSAFGFLEYDSDDEDGVPDYIADYSSEKLLDRKDCENVQIMRYDNNSKVGVPIDFDVLKYYDEFLGKKDLKKNIKKYNL